MLSKNLARARRDKGWTRRQLSDASTVHANTIADIENGRSRDPGFFKVEALAAALGVTSQELAGILRTPPPKRRRRTPPGSEVVDATKLEPLPSRVRREIRTDTDSDDYGIVASRG